MNYDRLTTVEVKVNRNRNIRLLIILALVAWALYCLFFGDFVLAGEDGARALDHALYGMRIGDHGLTP